MAEPTGGGADAAPSTSEATAITAWAPTVEQLSKYVVLASLATYGLGYMVAVCHYTGAGVPATELSHNTFIGAGLLFAAFIGMAFVALRATRSVWHQPDPKWTRVIFVATAYGAIALLAMHPFAIRGLPVVVFQVYFLVAVLLCAYVEAGMRRKGRRLVPLLVIYVSFIVIFGPYFGSYLFPLSRPELGGGRPVLLFTWNRGGPPLQAPPVITTLRCTDPTVVPACTIVSLVYASASHLYLSVEERATPCPEIAKVEPWPIGRGWVAAWPSLKSKDTKVCFARVADSDVKTLTIPALP